MKKLVILGLLIVVGWAMIGMMFSFFRFATNDTSFVNISGGVPDWEEGIIKLAPMFAFALLMYAGYKVIGHKDKEGEE